jgi:hypothetical protein
MAAFSITEKVAWDQVRQVNWVGDNGHVFGQKFLGEKGSVR